MSDNPLVDVLRRQNEGLLSKLKAERNRIIKLEAQINGLTITNRQLQMQHDQDVKDLRILNDANGRIAMREKMVEGALNDAHRRLTPNGFRLDDDDEVTPQVTFAPVGDERR